MAGEIYALDCGVDGPCRLDYLPEPVEDEPGWPVLVSGPCRGTARTQDGGAIAACDSQGAVLVHQFSAAGVPRAGWPVRLPGSTASVYDNLFTIGCGDDASSLALTSTGALVVAVVDGSEALVHVLEPDGSPRSGWPRPFPGDSPGHDGIGGNGCRGFDLGPDGSILVWGYEGVEQDIELSAARTELSVYEPDGRTRSGWPRGSTGAASRPVIGADGSVTYVSASGKVWRHEAGGKIAAGWPYQLKVKTAPYVTPDGRIVVIDGEHGSRTAISLDRSGAMVPGWPVALDDVETRCLFGDTPCAGSVEPAIGADGALYVALGDGSIVALESAGRDVAGWPVELGEGAHVTDLRLDGSRLVVAAVRCSSDDGRCLGDSTPMTLLLGRDGSPVK